MYRAESTSLCQAAKALVSKTKSKQLLRPLPGKQRLILLLKLQYTFGERFDSVIGIRVIMPAGCRAFHIALHVHGYL